VVLKTNKKISIARIKQLEAKACKKKNLNPASLFVDE